MRSGCSRQAERWMWPALAVRAQPSSPQGLMRAVDGAGGRGRQRQCYGPLRALRGATADKPDGRGTCERGETEQAGGGDALEEPEPVSRLVADPVGEVVLGEPVRDLAGLGRETPRDPRGDPAARSKAEPPPVRADVPPVYHPAAGGSLASPIHHGDFRNKEAAVLH